MYDKLLKLLDEGQAVLTAGAIHPDIPTIHDVGHRDGHRLQTDTPVEHYGFGLFVAQVDGGEVSFDGGGAMYRERDRNGGYAFSWTLLRASAAQLDALGYDLGKVRAAVSTLDIRNKIRETAFDGGLGL